MPAAAANAADDQGVASSRMSYSRFLVRGPHRPRIRWQFLRLSEISRRRFSDALGRRAAHIASMRAIERLVAIIARDLNVPIPRATPKTTSVDFAPGGSFLYLSTFFTTRRFR